ncbi:16S rRNA (cytosine(1402)-N(4))-methyltransferase RsmH [Sneathiella glossodoripedis]|uniref:16S rRNA (cytosine(1402)-N(4))-methyltransferase RsmH n=1 Tax=Sneathiella glossodoripedis TaxID=418853 RepID=UPI00047121F6|nr:16S rRNA (cytosine(1402)-N(4))-methyltransferase RsmH [Sneathiella glossodoripedis]
MSDRAPHVSVLLNEVLEVLSPKPNEIVVDGTFGAAGYSRAILAAADCKLYGIDRDPRAIRIGRDLEREMGDRFTMLSGVYGDMQELLAQNGVHQVDGIALDIGVSSMQIDEAERGFSFMQDGPLDMRMSAEGQTAADVVNEMDEEQLVKIIYRYGEERRARAVARAIVERRSKKAITRTIELAELIATVVRPSGKGIHPATRTFQALRIHVNDELGQLREGLEAAERLLAPGGRLAVVSFHSLEDRLVKNFLAERANAKGNPSRHVPLDDKAPSPSFELIKRGAIKATKEEITLNPRSRSARLRGAIRTDAPVWGGV